MALVEKALQPPSASETPLQPCNFSIGHMTGAASAQNNPGEYGVCPKTTQDGLMRKRIPDRSDVSVEDGARLLLEFVASVRAAHRTPSP